MKKLLLLLAFIIYSFANSVDEQFLEPEDAFQVEFIQNEDSLNIKLSLGQDIYLYDDKLQINITKPKKIELLKDINLPKAVEYKGFIVHFDNLDLLIPYSLLKEKINLKDIENAKKESGIKENSPLHASRYFHCTQNFVFDPMHDIFEGIAPMELKLVLHHFLTHGQYNLKLDTFNSRIHLFRYGSPE